MSPKPSLEQIASEVVHILRVERERQSVSMTELAVKSRLSQQMISYVEREMRNPTLDTLLRITSALNLSLSDVLKQAETRASRKKP
jgi:transcriptional regulator with XRE-family HTH domain